MLSDEDKQWVREQLDETSRRFSEQLDQTSQRFSEQLEKLETTLLTEFHKWASPQEMRQRTHAAAIRALEPKSNPAPTGFKNLEGR